MLKFLGQITTPASLPIARFDGKTIKPMTSGLDKQAQSAVERIGERQQIKRPEARG